VFSRNFLEWESGGIILSRSFVKSILGINKFRIWNAFLISFVAGGIPDLSTDMSGKVCLVTGATSGVGRATLAELAARGGTVIGVGRDSGRIDQTRREILDSTGNSNVEFILADLSVLGEIRNLAMEFNEKYSRLDVLINNAGAFFLRRRVSLDGFEMTWALNHLSYFLFTNLLLEQIRKSVPARIVNVASGAHYRGRIHFEDINLMKWYNGWKAYSQSKLANILFTYELDRRLKGDDITVNSLTPGFVATRIGHNSGRLIASIVQQIQMMGGITPQEGAQTMVYLATSPGVERVSGKFFREKNAVQSSPMSYDKEIARQVWEISEHMTDLG
jgi:NAD(P)-dependent dehydrogenase (short-subunit alcohol dehydrogenase family)